MNKHTCCFLGHRKIKTTNILKDNLTHIIENLITDECVDTFLFGSKSQFDDLCHQIVSDLKVKYSDIRRIYVRANNPYISDDYKAYLLQNYEDTYYPDNIINAGKFSYVERNFEMIDKSKFCIMYFDEFYIPSKRKNGNSEYQPASGTKVAYEYAQKKKKMIINAFKPEKDN